MNESRARRRWQRQASRSSRQRRRHFEAENSFIKWAVDQGHTVFVISWINPDERLAHKGFEDYMLEGPLAVLDVIGAAAGEREVNAIGYCLGGTLLAATLAYLTAHARRSYRTGHGRLSASKIAS